MSFFPSSLVAAATTFIAFSSSASAFRLLESNSLNPCEANANFTASLFDAVLTPHNNTLTLDMTGVSSIQGNVTALVEVIAYGYVAVKQTVNPCDENLEGLCPVSTGPLNIQTNIEVGDDVINRFPGITFTVPDLDMQVRVHINSTSSGESVACVEADVSNGKTVYQKSVGWVTAVIAGLGLATSAISSSSGHSNTATHIAANALSLFAFFQAQALIGMTSVPMPPIVESWTQNFQWSLGIIKVGFLQSICTWYQRATGGTPSNLLSTLSTISVQVQKRSLEYISQALAINHELVKRSGSTNTTAKMTVVKGIERVGFRAGIERTNIFLTGLIFFLTFCVFVAIFVVLFKRVCELGVRQGWLKNDKFSDLRNGGKIILKGIFFRLILIGYPQMAVLCLWEIIERDSPAELLLGIVVFVSMTATLGWAALKVIRLARKSVTMYKNPAYMLYSNSTYLNKWGFLFVQFRATAYYFVLPSLGYNLLKGIFIAFAQGSDVTQAIALLIIEGGFLIAISVLRPWMDKKTNVFNISIGAVNFLNAIFLLFFTSIFGQPGLVNGVMGVVFFVYNAAFALVLLLLVLIASAYAVFSKNPDLNYQPMQDDRGSFIKSSNTLHTAELDALGATARGDVNDTYGKYRSGETEDDDSFFSESRRKEAAATTVHNTTSAGSISRPVSTANSGRDMSVYQADAPNSRNDPPPPGYGQRGMYTQSDPSSVSTFGSGYPAAHDRSHTASPQPYTSSGHGSGGGQGAQ